MTAFDKTFIRVHQQGSEEQPSPLPSETTTHSVTFVPSQSENDAITELAFFPEGTVVTEVAGIDGLLNFPRTSRFFEIGDIDYEPHFIESVDAPAIVETADIDSESKQASEAEPKVGAASDILIHDAGSPVPRPHLGFPVAKTKLPTAEPAQTGFVAEPHLEAESRRRISAAVLLDEPRPCSINANACESNPADEIEPLAAVSTIPNARSVAANPAASTIASSYTWPATYRRLFESASCPLDELADRLTEWIDPPRCVIGILGCRPKSGSTTLTHGLGLRLAGNRRRTILVDADFTAPDLCNRLQVHPELGWDSALAYDIPLERAILNGTSAEPALLPLRQAIEADGIDLEAFCRRANNHLSELAERYDIVLVDLGSITPESEENTESTTHCTASECKSLFDTMRESIRLLGPRLDTVLLVTDQSDSREQLNRFRNLLEQSAVDPLGVVENFAA